MKKYLIRVLKLNGLCYITLMLIGTVASVPWNEFMSITYKPLGLVGFIVSLIAALIPTILERSK